jgi:hypothetical protein
MTEGVSEAELVGFFPKRRVPVPDWLEAPSVLEICSVSHCIAAGPEDWIGQWLHNEDGFYDSEALAKQVAAGGDFDLYAYRLAPVRCNNATLEPFTVAKRDLALPADYVCLGWDVVTRSTTDFFECSPLSCNSGAAEYPVNEYCLLASHDVALEVMQSICAGGKSEPGPYYLFQVYRKESAQ